MLRSQNAHEKENSADACGGTVKVCGRNKDAIGQMIVEAIDNTRHDTEAQAGKQL